jgi:hypothetical protein
MTRLTKSVTGEAQCCTKEISWESIGTGRSSPCDDVEGKEGLVDEE